MNLSIAVLGKSVQNIDQKYSIPNGQNHISSFAVSNKIADEQLNEQMNFIYKISGDIGKLTNLITAQKKNKIRIIS